MERKYYLRGLGLGIVMTAIIMGIALSGSHKMTDAQVIQRARELGMVEDTYLADAGVSGEQQAKQNIEDDSPEPGETPEIEPESESPQTVGTDISEGADVSGEAVISEETGSAEPAKPVETEPASVESEDKAAETRKDTNEMTKQEETPSTSAKEESVTIVGGDGSYTVALKLKEAGIVTSAETFDDFLCERGYDKKLRTGTFRIPVDASDEQIARIVTGQE